MCNLVYGECNVEATRELAFVQGELSEIMKENKMLKRNSESTTEERNKAMNS